MSKSPGAAVISRREARELALVAQGLAGPALGGTTALLDCLGAIQLDTISVLARSHLLVSWSRLGPLDRARVEGAFWTAPAQTFEYWAHAACIIPIAEWPIFAFRRRAAQRKGRRWHRLEDPERLCGEIRARLVNEGPLTATDLGGAKKGGPWWDWSDTKIAVEWLLDIGEVICTRRVGWRRVYDLTERCLPTAATTQEPDDASCYRSIVALSGRALGVATVGDLARHYRIPLAAVREVVADSGLIPVSIEGIAAPCYGHPDVLGALGSPMRSRTVLLSPFDSLLWDRARAERIFGFVHRLEAYVPRPDRVHGYYAMPLLHNGQIVGRVDPKREGTTLVVKNLSLERRSSVPAALRAVKKAARWVQCDTIRIDAGSASLFAADLAGALLDPTVSDSVRGDDGRPMSASP